jgi:hypothetical protein
MPRLGTLSDPASSCLALELDSDETLEVVREPRPTKFVSLRLPNRLQQLENRLPPAS